MAIVVDFIRRLAPWIYGACALVALWYLRAVILARRERRYAVFRLERETALNRVYGGWIAALALAAVMGGVYVLSTVVSDAVQPLIQEGELMTPTELAAGGLPSVTPTLPLPETTPTSTATRRPRSTPRPQPTMGPVETPTPAPQRPYCPDARSVITSPGTNAVVSGQVPIFGTATHANFSYYKLEWGLGADPTDWHWAFEGKQPVQDGQLYTLDVGSWPSGTYTIRLVVVDVTGNFVDPPCRTTIVVP